MIVRFDFERRNEAVADVHDAGVFPRTLHHKFATRRKPLQVHLARFVGAVLAPHHAENAQLSDVRIAAKNLLNARVLLARYAVLGCNFRRYLDFSNCSRHQAVALAAPTSASTIERKITRPSEEPRVVSAARSGCGISPATLRSR